MTYAWELVLANTQKFRSGEQVTLNPEWSGYAYLKREFGECFPRAVGHVKDDVVTIKVGKVEIQFARQTLTRYAA